MQLHRIKDQLTAEIADLEQAIINREAQIEALVGANQTALARIDQLRDAETAIDAALAKLDQIGPMGCDVGTPKRKKAQRRLPTENRFPYGEMRRAIMLMLTDAGPTGMTIEQIADHYAREHEQELNRSSVRTLLYQAAHEGLTERHEDGTWRLRRLDAKLEAAD